MNSRLAEFRKKLGELNTKSSSKIRELTDVAIRYQNEALDMSLQWDAEVKAAGIVRYQPLFSLVDSILKKASAAYKAPLGQILLERYPECVRKLKLEKDEKNLEFFHKMLTVSWIKHSLLAADILSDIEKRVEEIKNGVVPLQPAPPASSRAGATVPAVQAGRTTVAAGGQYDEAKRKRIIQIMHNLVTGQIAPGDREEIITIPEICEAIRLQKEGKKFEAQKQLARFKQVLEPDGDDSAGFGVVAPPQQPGVRGAAQQPGGKAADAFGAKRPAGPQQDTAANAAKRAKLDNRVFNMDWCARFLEKLPGHKKTWHAQGVGRQILGSTQDQYLGVDELHPNEVQLILQFIFQVEEHIRASEEAALESSAIPLHFNTVRHVKAERLLEKYYEDFPFQCMTSGRRFQTRATLALFLDQHYKNNLKRRKMMQRDPTKITEEKTYRGWENTVQDIMGVRDLKLGSLWQQDKKVEEHREEQEAEEEQSNADDTAMENIAPYSEGQPCCPVCGELFSKVFFNGDWWVTGVTVMDVINMAPLRYDTSSSGRRLHENALIYHKGCLPDSIQM
ncbi:unnamed protein product [Amoebophrya sp. A120]|nr:unnamed protein product [Amoebophrya sp. A120]|eukprot:GSA120T00010997001.1